MLTRNVARVQLRKKRSAVRDSAERRLPLRGNEEYPAYDKGGHDKKDRDRQKWGAANRQHNQNGGDEGRDRENNLTGFSL
jgi:hypothetical protein